MEDTFIFAQLGCSPQVKSSYPIVPIQTYSKIAMSSTSSLGLLVPTNIGRFTEVGGVLTLQPSSGHSESN
jgi:hypothetical protein